jgi:DNA-binding LacI/PurR family transcriptional regulator/signal transduction histidine kinase
MARRKVIALLTNGAGLGDDYQGELRRGVELACQEHDLDLWVYAGRSNWTVLASHRQVYDLMDSRRIDGIVFAAGCIASYAPLEEVLAEVRRRCPVPMSAVGQLCPEVPSIMVDNARGVTRLVDHLVRVHARRKIAYVAGPAGHDESEERLRGAREGLTRHGIPLPDEAVLHGDFSPLSGSCAVRTFISRHLEFDAVMAANDDMALGALDALRSAGLDCPAQVVVAGFDDVVSARVSDPPLTTVRQPTARAGALAVAHLLQQWNGRRPAQLVFLETEVVIRESCGCRATDAAWHQGRASSRQPDEPPLPAELTQALAACIDTEQERVQAATQLLRAVHAERAGHHGALLQVVASLVRGRPELHVPIFELQRVITSLRSWAFEQGAPAALDDAFHSARALVGAQAYRRVAEQYVRYEYLLEALRSAWEQLATCLSLPALKQALLSELPRIGIRDALVSVYPRDHFTSLLPLACLEDGVARELEERSYPAELLVPDGVFAPSRRRSLTVVPLTFKNEQLGVAVLDCPLRMGIYTFLREQIGSAIKAVHQHEEILNQERLHAQAQEEKRATAERLRSLSVIAGGVAHDLNNVLGPLLALPETIQADLERGGSASVPVEVLKDLDTIRHAARRAAHTIGDLVVLGRSQEMPKTKVDLNRLLLTERLTFADICQKNPHISWRLDTLPGRLVVSASRPHLVRAISNLVINAVDAIQGPGTITIRALERAVTERLPGVEPIDPGRYGVVEVEDTGSGIRENLLPRILEPFFSAKQEPGQIGSGLGLAIVHRIVGDAGGYVRVDSQVGRGSIFGLYFPLRDQSDRPSSHPPRAAAGGHERILVVDDELVQLRTARRILEHLGYTVETAQSPEEALRIFSQCRSPAFDLVVVDMVMPGTLNGIATIEQMRRARPGQKALIASGYAPEEMDTLAAQRGLSWLAKPYTLAGLASSIRAALEG